MLVTETTGIKLLPKIIVLNPKDGIILFGRHTPILQALVASCLFTSNSVSAQARRRTGLLYTKCSPFVNDFSFFRPRT